MGRGMRCMPVLDLDLGRVLGWKACRQLQEECGGSLIYVPCRFRDRHWLVAVLGTAGLMALIAEMGGCRLYVPVMREDTAARNQQIYQEWIESKTTIAEIAKHFSLSDRQIHRILDEERRAQETQDLYVIAG